jgi:hypothetical protein
VELPEKQGIRRRTLCSRTTHISKFIQDGWVKLAHFYDEGEGGEEDTMVAVSEKVLGFRNEVITELRYLF